MSDPWSAPDAATDVSTFSSLGSLARVLQAQQGLYALLLVLSAGFSLLFAGDTSDEALLAEGGVAVLVLLVVLLGTPVWMLFHHRAATNLVALGIPLRHGPWAQVLWWFVPVFNLFKPYAATKELLVCSEPTAEVDEHGDLGLPTAPEALKVYDTLPAWWMLFVAGTIINRLANRAAVRGIEVPALLNAVGPLVMAGAAVFYFQVVGRLATAQQELHEARRNRSHP